MSNTAYDDEIKFYASKSNLDPKLITAMVLTESSGKTNAYRYEQGFWDRYLKDNINWKASNPDRVSASYGLMQIMYPTAVDYGFPRSQAPEELFHPETNLMLGCKIVRLLLAWTGGDVEKMLCAYNGGKGIVAHKPYPNQYYADKVIGIMNSLKG